MGDKENRDAARAQLVDLAQAALPEVDVADRQSFVNEKNLGVHVDGDGESQPDDHAARVCLDRLVDEIANLGEVRDVGEFPVHRFRGKAQDGCVQVDVVAAGEFRVESGSKFEERGDPPIHLHRAGTRLQDARKAQ